MIRRPLVALVLLAALAGGLAACGDDDDTGAPVDQTEPTEVVEEEDPGEPFLDTTSSGSGTIVIGDETFEYEVTSCFDEDDGAITIAGPGTTAAGEDFFGEVGTSADEEFMSAGVAVGQTTFGQGDPNWQLISGVVPDATVERNGEVRISFSADFDDSADDGTNPVAGSVDASCAP